MTGVCKHSRRYIVQAAGLIAALSAAVWGLGLVLGADGIVIPLVVSAVFSLVIECADALIWRRVAGTSSESLPSFYTAVSGFRMLLALAVMFVYWLVEGQESMKMFFFVFAAYYIMLLAHHSIFFAGVSGSIDKLNDVK